MKLINTVDKPYRTEYHYDSAIITEMHPMMIYFDGKTRITYTDVFDIEVYGIESPLPDFTTCDEAQLFQYSLLYDIDFLLPIQVEMKGIAN